MNGWFPRYSPDGLRVTAERSGYWQAQWLDATTEIAHNGSVLLIAGAPTEIPSPNELSAGGGTWVAYRGDPVRIYASDGRVFAGAGCPVVNPLGYWGYVDDRQADTKNLIWRGVAIARGGITEARASRTALVWSDNGRTWGIRLDQPDVARLIQAAALEFRPIPIDTPTGPWVGNHTATGLILRPFGDVRGYRFDNGGQTFYPDWKFANNAIVAIFTDDRGEQTEHTFDLSAPRVPLDAIIDIPPTFPTKPVPIPAPPTEPNPMPVAPNQLSLIRSTIAAHPEINTLADGPFSPNRGGITQIVAAQLGLPYGRKSRDGSQTNLSDDALCYRLADGRFEIYDILSGSDGSATFDYAGTFGNGENGFFVAIAQVPPVEPPTEPPVEPPQPPFDPTPINARIDALSARIDLLSAALAALGDRVGSLRAKGRTRTMWGHQHDVELEIK